MVEQDGAVGDIIDITPDDHVVDVRISVSEELRDHYKAITDMRNTVLNDKDSDPKDKIAILKLTMDIIKEFARIQDELYNSETQATLQQAIVDVLRGVDEDLCDKVLKAFDARLAELR